MNRPMERDNPAGMLRKEDVTKETKSTKIPHKQMKLLLGELYNEMSDPCYCESRETASDDAATQREPSDVSGGKLASYPSSLIGLTRC
jgi:hypothetical protein